jgi:hypothetical protein
MEYHAIKKPGISYGILYTRTSNAPERQLAKMQKTILLIYVQRKPIDHSLELHHV